MCFCLIPIVPIKNKSQGNYILNPSAVIQGVPKFVPRLCGYCGGAVDSITSNFTQLHRSSFNFEFYTLYESI